MEYEEYAKYNKLTKMYRWCAGHNFKRVYYQTQGYCHVLYDYNHNGNLGREIHFVGVSI